MTGPAVPSNEEIVAAAETTVLEGEESQTVADAVVGKFGEVQTALAEATTQLEAAKGQAMDETTRQSILDKLTTAKTASDNFQQILGALVAPPSAPGEEPVGRRRGGKK